MRATLNEPKQSVHQGYRALDNDARAAVDQLDAEHNRIYLDPVQHGAYPELARPELLPGAITYIHATCTGVLSELNGAGAGDVPQAHAAAESA